MEYPRKGLYSLAFITNEQRALNAYPDLVSVFVPTTPNSTSGFFLLVSHDEIDYVDIPIEDAFTMIMSAGIVLSQSISARTLEQTQIDERTKSIVSQNDVID